ncbi:MAG: PAS domain S-box protein [bacterium]
MTISSINIDRVFDLFPDMIFILDAQLRIVDMNLAACQGTGYSDKDLRQIPFEQIVEETAWKALSAVLQNGSTIQGYESRFLKTDKLFLDVDLDIRHLNDHGEKYQVIIARDITELKKKELDLLRFSNVVQHTVNPIQITDANGRMVMVNPAFEKSSGYSKEELIGKNPRILSSGKHSREFWKSVWEHIMTGKVWVGELENLRRDGTPFHTELVISPIVDTAGVVKGFLGAHRDITEQKLLEQQLVRSQRMESIGTLAAGIAHEVGNPLTSISSLVQVIQRTTNDEAAKEKLELIKKQITRIARIIRDLVDFSRPSTHVIKSTDINHIVREALNIVQYGKKVKNIQFLLSFAENLPLLNVVPDQLTQVFINILMNAVDALESKPGTITINTRYIADRVEVMVRDSGRGISQEDMEKIFEPFFTTKQVGQGTGLGLWVSYGIVKKFGGDIVVESQPGAGTTMEVYFPVKGV